MKEYIPHPISVLHRSLVLDIFFFLTFKKKIRYCQKYFNAFIDFVIIIIMMIKNSFAKKKDIGIKISIQCRIRIPLSILAQFSTFSEIGAVTK